LCLCRFDIALGCLSPTPCCFFGVAFLPVERAEIDQFAHVLREAWHTWLRIVDELLRERPQCHRVVEIAQLNDDRSPCGGVRIIQATQAKADVAGRRARWDTFLANDPFAGWRVARCAEE
jgi:hypothetical protein